ncbi:MAG: hypothetical protein QOF51_2161 [Chloroflexota bacterium]|nr:hypothetical protein [Chloroflexota bacterium]
MSNPATFNRYVYTGQNPVSRADPSGMDWYDDLFGPGSKQARDCRDLDVQMNNAYAEIESRYREALRDRNNLYSTPSWQGHEYWYETEAKPVLEHLLAEWDDKCNDGQGPGGTANRAVQIYRDALNTPFPETPDRAHADTAQFPNPVPGWYGNQSIATPPRPVWEPPWWLPFIAPGTNPGYEPEPATQ